MEEESIKFYIILYCLYGNDSGKGISKKREKITRSFVKIYMKISSKFFSTILGILINFQ